MQRFLSQCRRRRRREQPTRYVGINTAQQVTFEANYIAPATPTSLSPQPLSLLVYSTSTPSTLPYTPPHPLVYTRRVASLEVETTKIYGGCCRRWCTERQGCEGCLATLRSLIDHRDGPRPSETTPPQLLPLPSCYHRQYVLYAGS